MPIQKKKINILFLFYLAVICSVSSQTTPISLGNKIDALFAGVTNQNSPGCVIGIIRNDTVIYTKGYGLASIENKTANTANTVFNTASVSKQFTAYAIILLVQQKKLSLDADIRTYLKWFPDLKEKITVRNLLNHTSGIRDQWDLVSICAQDITTQDQIVKLLSKQQALNFKPGERYAYSNSNYTLLAEIVKSVSGKPFRAFTDSAIFKPLGMNSTFFHDAIEITKNRADLYSRMDSVRFENITPNTSIVGATNLFTSVSDISKWMIHLCKNEKAITLLTQKGKLNNGEEINYAAGLYIDTYKGKKTFYHGGAENGFQCHLTVFPELKTGIIILDNSGDVDAQGKVNEIADILIPANLKNETKQEQRDSALAFIKDTVSIKKFIGCYLSETGLQRQIIFKNKKLYVARQGKTDLLYPLTKDTLSLFAYPDTRLILSIDPKKKDTLLRRNDRYVKYQLKKYTPSTPTAKELEQCVGSYYCPELDSKQNIELKNNQLILKYPKFDIPLTSLGNDYFQNGYCFVMLRNVKKEIIGFEINGERVLHLRFNKIQ